MTVARFAALLEPPVRLALSPTLDTMKELHIARRGLVKDRVAASNRASTRRSALLKRQAKERPRQIERQIAAREMARVLTAREMEIVQLAGRGLTNKEIAAKFEVSVRTIESHRESLLRKLGVKGTAGLTRFAIGAGLLNP